MDKIVVLELKGNLEQGFYVTLQIVQPGGKLGSTMDGYLPASPALLQDLTQWQADYRRLSTPARSIKPYKVKVDGKIHPLDVCVESAQQLVHQFQRWLRADSFREVEMHLHQVLMPTDAVQVLIRTTNCEAQALPWQLWDFIEHYSHAEVALSGVSSTPDQTEKCVIPEDESLVKILAVLGDRHNIDIESDRQTLSQLPGSYVEFLVEPTHQQLNDTLYEQRWDILFFAGHSDTEAEGQGILRLNAKDHLTIDEVRYAVRRAIANGLKLAIFNSCNGLGLAHALAKLQLPYMIVMREAVPDPVAQQFLKYFLRAFAEGRSLHLAEREARERLQGMEKEYPCASWLPIIVQKPATEVLTWQSFLAVETPNKAAVASLSEKSLQSNWAPLPSWPAICRVLIAAFLVTSLVLGVRSQGFLQNSELKAYDRLVQLRPKAPQDERLLLITVDEEDMTYQDEHSMVRKPGWSLSDKALSLVFQNTSNHPRVIGLDIYHPYAFEPDLASSIAASPSSFVGICEMDSQYSTPETMTPPPTLAEEQIGFSDMVIDPDRVVRRHLISMSAGDNCKASHAFSLQVVEQYLQAAGLTPIKRLSDGRQQIEDFILERFEYNSGGYQLPPTWANGYQVLLNYRHKSPKSVPLRLFLETPSEWWLHSGSVVLIGVKQAWQDQHRTPLKRTRIPGIEIHAHMISQLLDAALEGKGILWWLSEWQESIWMLSWAFGAGIWAMCVRSRFYLGLGIACTISILFITCWLLLLIDGWVPLIPTIFGILGTAIVTAIVDRGRRHIGA